MRCFECHTEPLTPGHYCECCGRKLSKQEIRAQEPQVTTDANQPAGSVAAASAAPAPPAGRCGSCGGPSPNGDVCATCQQAFSSVLGTSNEQSLSPASPALIIESSSGAAAFTFSAPPAASTGPIGAVKPAVSQPEAVRPPAVRAETPKSEKVQPPRTPPRAVASKPPVQPVRPTRSRRPMVLGVAAVVIVAAIGVPLGVLRLGNQVPAPPATNVAPEEPPQVAEREAPAKRRAAVPITPAEPEPVAKRVASTPAPPPVAAAARSRAGGSGSSRLDRESNSGAAQAPSVAASRATTPAPALVAAAAPATQAQVQPQSAAPEPPSGRLFDQTGVDDPPRILSRVEPRLPNDLPERRGNDVVVVRILVSHTGHPFQVGLLRRSRLGPSLDDAVVAAVKQWTFAPARKRGEAVSCWFNLGVPVVVN